MTGDHAVGRVIARLFTGGPVSTGRGPQGLQRAAAGPLVPAGRPGVGRPVVAVGKVRDLFAGVGIDQAHPGPTNALALEQLARLVGELEAGLVFANLVETDQL